MLKKSLCLVLGFMCIGDVCGSFKRSFPHSDIEKGCLAKKVCLTPVSHIEETSNIRTDENWKKIIRNSETYLEKDLLTSDVKTALASRWDGRPINWAIIYDLANQGNSYAQFFWGEKLFNEAISPFNIEERIDIAKKIELLKKAYKYIFISGIIGKNPITMEEYDLPDINISSNHTDELFEYAQRNAEKSVF